MIIQLRPRNKEWVTLHHTNGIFFIAYISVTNTEQHAVPYSLCVSVRRRLFNKSTAIIWKDTLTSLDYDEVLSFVSLPTDCYIGVRSGEGSAINFTLFEYASPPS